MQEVHGQQPPWAWSKAGWKSERASNDPTKPEAWCYTDRYSYAPGDTVSVRVHSTVPQVSIRVIRDGLAPELMFERTGVSAQATVTPEDSYTSGCGWPVAFEFVIPDSWRSGFYLVTIRAVSEGEVFEREHFFVVRAPAGRTNRLALILTTSTLNAYNDWGGANMYRGLSSDPRADYGVTVSSSLRPIARGHLRKPVGAPRGANSFTPRRGWVPRYEALEWAYFHGYSRHHADAFWATYERPFVEWAEGAGYELDYLTQEDLHRPNALDSYRCVIVVGHDEYWSWEMRDAVDEFVDAGGHLARFAGNFTWQIRLEDDLTRQVCYRDPTLDPITDLYPRRATTIWDARSVGRPSAETMGLSGMAGVYGRVGVTTPRSSGGFTIYRPDHWAFADADLYYGDVVGAAPVCAAAYELDTCEFTFRRGLPYPTGEDGAPDSLEILALAPAVIGERDRWNGTVPLLGPEREAIEILQQLGDDAPPYLIDRTQGAGMIAAFERGRGSVFNAGSSEWVSGLIHRDEFVEKITRNVLDRFSE